MQQEGAAKIDSILAETRKQTGMLDASAAEREERKRKEQTAETLEVRKYRIAVLSLLVPILLFVLSLAAGVLNIRPGADLTPAPAPQHHYE